MSQDSKKIVTVVVGTLATFGLAIIVGAVLVRGHGSHWMTYRQATASTAMSGDPTVFATVVGKVTPGLDLAKMFAVNAQVLARGKKIFDTDCAACHGANGKGDGAAAPALHPGPRDFTSAHGWTRGYTIADIYTTLSDGIPGTGMGAFNMIKPPDRFAVAHYVQSFGTFEHGDNQAEEIKQIDAKYHLSAGIHAPNKVAVPIVMRHMAAEYRAPPPVELPAASDSSMGAALCRRLVADPVRAAEVLSQVPDWRTQLEAFARAAIADTPRNGFRPAVATLTRTEWQAFHEELVARTPDPAPGTGPGPKD